MKALQINGTWKPRPGYEPTPREARDKRAVSADRIFENPTIGFADIPVPEPKDDEVLMKVGGVGVCGSDICFLEADKNNYSMYAGHCKMPCVIGHEYAGEVVKVGRKVRMFKPGDLITAETMNWCGECSACREGMFNQCENLEEIGFTLNGGYAEYLVAKEKFCFDISALLEIYGSKRRAMQVGALIEPLAVAYNGLFVRAGGFRPGSDVVIFGAGPIGVSALCLARTSGAANIILFEKMPGRIELAKKVGATHVFNLDELKARGKSPHTAIMEVTRGRGAGLIAECTEHQRVNMPEIETSLAVGGKIVQIGISTKTAPVHAEYLQLVGASYHGMIGSAGHGIWTDVINLIATRRIDPEQYMNPRVYKLDEALDAIRDAGRGVPGKNVVDPTL